MDRPERLTDLWPQALASWGDGKNSVAVGPPVLDHFVTGIEDWAVGKYGRMPGSWDPVRVAVGCVFRLTDSAVVDALLKLPASCVVVGKQRKLDDAAARLALEGPGAHTAIVPGLIGYGRVDSDGSLHPVDIALDSETDQGNIGSLRVAGWQEDRSKGPRRSIPLVHAKVLVLGYHACVDTDYGSEFTWVPDRAWVGSANWTWNARNSAEMGVWIDDLELAGTLSQWIGGLIALSEPHTSIADQPAGDLVEVDWPEPDSEWLREGDWDDDEA